MIRERRSSARAVALTTAIAIAIAGGASFAQDTQAVSFDPGATGAEMSGEITGQAYADYTLDARTGQDLSVTLTVTETDGDGAAFFNIMPPGADWEALYVGSMDEDATETVALPEDGTYTVRVYLMGNDDDAAKTVTYALDISIE